MAYLTSGCVAASVFFSARLWISLLKLRAIRSCLSLCFCAGVFFFFCAFKQFLVGSRHKLCLRSVWLGSVGDRWASIRSETQIICFDELRILVDCGHWRASNDLFQLLFICWWWFLIPYTCRVNNSLLLFIHAMAYNQNKGEMFKQKSISVQSTELTREWLSSRSKAIITLCFPCKPFFERQHETIFLCKNTGAVCFFALFCSPSLAILM